MSVYKVHMIVSTQESSRRTFTDLNRSFLWRMEQGIVGEEGTLLTHTILPCYIFFEYVLLFQLVLRC